MFFSLPRSQHKVIFVFYTGSASFRQPFIPAEGIYSCEDGHQNTVHSSDVTLMKCFDVDSQFGWGNTNLIWQFWGEY